MTRNNFSLRCKDGLNVSYGYTVLFSAALYQVDRRETAPSHPGMIQSRETFMSLSDENEVKRSRPTLSTSFINYLSSFFDVY